jgi:hypothetical protein
MESKYSIANFMQENVNYVAIVSFGNVECKPSINVNSSRPKLKIPAMLRSCILAVAVRHAIPALFLMLFDVTCKDCPRNLGNTTWWLTEGFWIAHTDRRDLFQSCFG